ncbi:MAG: hypothetical protein GDA49_13405 [Rhodospirillales bacterium]|nr:hypothetical protein [Rhodospirillales bacterium]
MSEPTWKSVSDTLRGWLTFIGFAFVSILGYWEYQTKVDQWKIEQALSFAERSGPPNVIEARRYISNVWRYEKSDLRRINEEIGGRGYGNRLHEIVEGDINLELDLFVVFSFYNEVIICVANDICSGDIATALLGEQIQVFWYRWEPFFDEYAEKIEDERFLCGIRHFVRFFSDYQKQTDAEKRMILLETWQTEAATNQTCPV